MVLYTYIIILIIYGKVIKKDLFKLQTKKLVKYLLLSV
jgi:hypothetical protein